MEIVATSFQSEGVVKGGQGKVNQEYSMLNFIAKDYSKSNPVPACLAGEV